MMTIDIIAKSQAGNGDATLELIQKFNPLLKKYAYKLHYEDAYDDLLIDFIGFLNDMEIENINNKSEGGIVNYVCSSIHSSYIKRLIRIKPFQKFLLYSELSDAELDYVESISSISDTYVEYDAIYNEKLTRSEARILQLIYLYGYTATEIATYYGISRQAVNQMKKRALGKLKDALSDKL